jgi:predicted phosphodiesterase
MRQPCDYYIDQSVGQHDVDQRIEEVKKICEWCKDFKEEGIDAVIITGDFNAHYTEMS